LASWLERYQRLIIVALAAVLAAAVVVLVIDRRNEPAPLELNVGSLTPTAGGPIEVYITGAVARPGVYEMKTGDRVVDVLQLAGGFTSDADPDAVALAKRLADEDTIVVPRVGQVSSDDTAGPSVAGTSVININRAPAEALDDALPGIGPVYSQRIVDSRTIDGPFVSPDDLLARGLIPQSTFEDIRELITVGP
jgi:competence protein ComEA